MTQKQLELRFSGASMESTEDGLKVSGYVNRTGEWSQELGTRKKFIERIMPGAFQKALQSGNEVHFLAEHDNAKILASTRNNSLTLREDENGLFMEATISDTSWGRDYHTLIKDGIIRNMSFGMKVLNDKWEKRSDGMYERSINDIHLAEVSAVRSPAYVQSTIAARSIKIIEEPTIKLSEEKEMQNLNQYRNKLDAWDNEEKRNTRTSEVRIVEDPKQEELKMRGIEMLIKGEVYAEEVRALTTDNQGVVVPTQLSNHIVKKLEEYAPLYHLTNNFTPVNGFLEILREQTMGNAGFIGEMTDANKNEFTMDKVRLDQKRVGTAIELSQHLVNDSGINVIDYVINILGRRLGQTIDTSILLGDKATQFEGIMIDPGNTIQKVYSQAAGAISIDDLLELMNGLHPNIQNGSVFVVNRNTFSKIVKLKDKYGQYYLIRDVAETGVSYTLFGHKVIINNAMPDIATGKKPVLFANLALGYATTTKKGFNLQHISDDAIQSAQGTHLLLLDAYMDGKILNQDALAVMVMK